MLDPKLSGSASEIKFVVLASTDQFSRKGRSTCHEGLHFSSTLKSVPDEFGDLTPLTSLNHEFISKKLSIVATRDFHQHVPGSILNKMCYYVILIGYL